MTRWTDRRAFRRTRNGEAGLVSAQVRPGHPAAVIDVSPGGVLIDSAKRLLPGAPVDLHLSTAGCRSTVRGRVLRCAVNQLRSSSVSYRAAIVFDRESARVVADDGGGYGVPASETPSFCGTRVEKTPDVV